MYLVFSIHLKGIQTDSRGYVEVILGHLNIRLISNRWTILQILECVNLSDSLNSLLELNNQGYVFQLDCNSFRECDILIHGNGKTAKITKFRKNFRSQIKEYLYAYSVCSQVVAVMQWNDMQILKPIRKKMILLWSIYSPERHFPYLILYHLQCKCRWCLSVEVGTG